jgi:hypothetical protein
MLALAVSCSFGCSSHRSGSIGSDAGGTVGHPDGAGGGGGNGGQIGARGGGSSQDGGTVTSDAGDGKNGCQSVCGAGQVCERYRAPTCVDPNWAAWPMPNAEIEVMAGAPNPQSYTDNGDGTVTDEVTKLMWQQLTPPMDLTQPEAAAYCPALALAGYTDWRLPAVIELVSIVDTGTYDPSIDSTIFPGTPAVGFYWSSTHYLGFPALPANSWMWGIYFNNGYADYNDASVPYSVRCVR